MTRPEALPTTSVLAVALLLAACRESAPPQGAADPRLMVDETAYFDNRLNGLWRYAEGSGSGREFSPDAALYAVASRNGTEIVLFLPIANDDEPAVKGMMLSFRPRPLNAGDAVYTRLNSAIFSPANQLPVSSDDITENLDEVFLRYRLAGDGTLEMWSLDADDIQKIFNPVEPCDADSAASTGRNWQELPIDALFARHECWPENGGDFELAGRFVRD